MSSRTCFVIAGPTAAGKTEYALELARRYRTGIISADSRQCFRELRIGVAKPSPAQLDEIRHYFIDSHSIHEEVNVKVFEACALEAVEDLFRNSDTAIVAGGTGLYLRAFCEGLDEVPSPDAHTRQRVRALYSEGGQQALQEEVRRIDPVFYARGEIQNPQRTMRALEVKMTTGASILDFHKGAAARRDFAIKKIYLEVPRAKLYERIDRRVDQMMASGLLQEAERLFADRHLNALQTVGYRELFNYLEGATSLEEAIGEIKKNTRQYARRQMTWFRKYL